MFGEKLTLLTAEVSVSLAVIRSVWPQVSVPYRPQPDEAGQRYRLSASSIGFFAIPQFD